MSNTEQSKPEVRAYPLAEPKCNILGAATVNLETSIGNFAIRDIRIIDGQNGPFAAMPSSKNKDGEYKDICFFSSQYSHDKHCYA
ncbi:MAG: septation protein SpoVG family protein [Lacrimispora sphenoides]